MYLVLLVMWLMVMTLYVTYGHTSPHMPLKYVPSMACIRNVVGVFVSGAIQCTFFTKILEEGNDIQIFWFRWL